ncbi:hypothetical protein [Microbacterium sp. OVT16B]|uniref:hypothetical protein n=1 Tax=Microbacterium sp. OVT16B TaxID=2862682 RepID=UPI001CC17402|nr:hypothetical protein [Microbacterium sp. OVT16B]
MHSSTSREVDAGERALRGVESFARNGRTTRSATTTAAALRASHIHGVVSSPMSEVCHSRQYEFAES